MSDNHRQPQTEEKVPVAGKVWLSFADCMCATLNGLLTGGGMTYFFTKFMGLSEELASVVWIIFAIWNAFNDPLFGYLSDRTKSKLGRRIPYIRYGSFFYALVFVLTWFKWPFGGSQTVLFIQMLVTLFLFDTFYTAIATSLYVMPYTMAVTNKARSSIFIWKIGFSLISLSVPLVVFPLIKPEVGEDPFRFQMIMTAIGVVTFLVIFFSTFFYKEKVQNEAEESMGLFRSVAECFKNRSFVVFEVLSFTVIFIQTILMQGVIYYCDEFDTPMPLAYGALGLGAVAGILLWIRMLRPWGVRKCVLIMCVSFACAAAVMCALGRFAPVALIVFFVTGVGFAGGMYLVPIMNGDVIDYDEIKTGARREGIHAGVNSLITKPAISLANAAFLMIAKWFGYDTALAAGMQSALAKQGVLVAWMAVPALLLALSAVAMKFYPLFGKGWEEQKTALARRHEQE